MLSHKTTIRYEVTIISLILILTACGTQSSQQAGIPLSTEKPTILIFCDTVKPDCEDTYNLMRDLTSDYNGDDIGIRFYYVDSGIGKTYFDSLALTSYPAYVAFNRRGNEIVRTTQNFDRQDIDLTIQTILD